MHGLKDVPSTVVQAGVQELLEAQVTAPGSVRAVGNAHSTGQMCSIPCPELHAIRTPLRLRGSVRL